MKNLIGMLFYVMVAGSAFAQQGAVNYGNPDPEHLTENQDFDPVPEKCKWVGDECLTASDIAQRAKPVPQIDDTDYLILRMTAISVAREERANPEEVLVVTETAEVCGYVEENFDDVVCKVK